jgi:predicted O-linked N-acetylglucosamine transferase (SPINDLY family)
MSELTIEAASPSARLRVGFVSRFFDQHIIAEVCRGLVRHLDRRHFEVIVFHAGPQPEIHPDLATGADRTLWLQAPHLAGLREQIARETLDILVYPDIGMEPITYFLAFARLAPVQCALTGHPDTTGIPNLDYFISSADLEAENAEELYSERLILLPQCPFLFYRPPTPDPEPIHRALELDPAWRLYACPQSMYKLHPDFDHALGRILRADPEGRLILIAEATHYQTDAWLQRFAREYGDVMDRVVFRSRLPYAQFCSLMQQADALLDPWPFGGGTTSYAAAAIGAPIVTWPHRFIGGRAAFATYQQMGILDTVATGLDDYVAKALRLAQDKAWHASLSERIRAGSDRFFDNLQTVRDLENFFLAAHDHARQGKRIDRWPQPMLA